MRKSIGYVACMMLAAGPALAEDKPMELPEVLEPVVNYTPESTAPDVPPAETREEAAAPEPVKVPETVAEPIPPSEPVESAPAVEKKTEAKVEEKAAAPEMAAPAPAPKRVEAPSPPLPRFDKTGEPLDSLGGDAIPALPLDIRTQGNVSYVTGGVGDEEMAMLRDIGKDFNLQLMLAATSGHYVSDAFIRVLDAQGSEVVSAENAGPYFYAKLPPGRYEVEITAPQGGIKKAEVTVPAAGFVKPIVRFTE